MVPGRNSRGPAPKNSPPQSFSGKKGDGGALARGAGKDKNPFKEMGFVRFWIVSTVFCLSFPLSLLVCCLALGGVRTRQLLVAIIQDFLLTLLVLIGLAALLIWLLYDYISGWFA